MALEARLSYAVKWGQDSTCDLSMCQIQPNQVKVWSFVLSFPPSIFDVVNHTSLSPHRIFCVLFLRRHQRRGVPGTRT